MTAAPPKVSVVCLSYRHAPYVRAALDGFCAQETDFPFEVLVHDDASDDGTAEIIRDYAARRPDILRPIFQTENQWRRCGHLPKRHVYPRLRGRYVAFCEADDYWTDPRKLQKQADFLDANPDVALCFHPVEVRWEGESRPPELFPSPRFRFHRRRFAARHLLRHNFVATPSVMYRWRFGRDPLDLIPEGILPGDHFLHLLHLETGGAAMLDGAMAVYRRHPGSLWADAHRTDAFYLRHGVRMMNFHRAVLARFPGAYARWMAETEARTLADRFAAAALRSGAEGEAALAAFREAHPAYAARALRGSPRWRRWRTLARRALRGAVKYLP